MVSAGGSPVTVVYRNGQSGASVVSKQEVPEFLYFSRQKYGLVAVFRIHGQLNFLSLIVCSGEYFFWVFLHLIATLMNDVNMSGECVW